MDVAETALHPDSGALAGVERLVFDALASSGAGFRNGHSSLQGSGPQPTH